MVFTYSADERKAIARAIPVDTSATMAIQEISLGPNGTSITNYEISILEALLNRLETAAEIYLQWIAASRVLQSRAALKRDADKTIATLRSALKLVREQPGGRSSYLRQQYAKDGNPNKSFEKFLCELVASDEVSWWPVKQEFASDYLEYLVEDIERNGTADEQAKGAESKIHRREFLSIAIEQWGGIMGKVEISKVDSSPMQIFIAAACDPVFNLSGENIGADQIARIVREIVIERAA